MTNPPDWTQASCAGHPHPDWWFPRRGNLSRRNQNAIQICSTCPIQAGCALYAARHDLHGIWGGLTDPQRRQLGIPVTPLPRYDLQPCGTYAAYRRHHRNNEQPCWKCVEANRLYQTPP